MSEDAAIVVVGCVVLNVGNIWLNSHFLGASKLGDFVCLSNPFFDLANPEEKGVAIVRKVFLV